MFHVEERLYDAAGEEDIKETLAAGGDKKETKTKVYASGEPVGIYIKTKGVLVLGIQDVKRQTTEPAHRQNINWSPGIIFWP